VNFDQFDADGNGTVTSDELSVLLVDNRSNNSGMSSAAATTTPSGSSVSVKIEGAAVGVRTSFLTIVHELTHTLGAEDLYGASNLSVGLTLMSGNRWGYDDRRSIHLDPYYTMRLGWSYPSIYSMRETGHSTWSMAAEHIGAWNGAVILYDPRRGYHEYFILEYRDSVSDGFDAYDQDAADNGVAIWAVRTKSNHEPLEVEGVGRAVWTLGAPDFEVGGTDLWDAGHGDIRLPWADGSATNVVISAASSSGRSTSFDWGWYGSPAPNMLSGPASITRGSASWSTIEGDFNADRRSRPIVLYDPTSPDRVGQRREFGVTVSDWTVDHVLVKVPSTVPTGSYRLRVYEDTGRRTAGTWIPVTVR
jgi:hypothetical protein